jgi:hypothetical protein
LLGLFLWRCRSWSAYMGVGPVPQRKKLWSVPD